MIKTREENDETVPGALTIWQMLREEKNVYETEEQDAEAVRKRIESIFQGFERVLQRSLPRPVIAVGRKKTECPASKPEDDALFQKLKRIESRLTSPPVDSGCDGRFREMLENPVKNGGFDFVLDLTGCDGGRFGSTGKDGTIRINTRTLTAIWAADDVRAAARTELLRGRWIVYAADPPGEVNESIEKAVEFFHATKKLLHPPAF